MAETKVKTLVETYKMVRALSERYISKLEGLDVKKVYEVNGVKMNSAYWIMAHMAWSEHFLIIEGVGGDSMGIEWLNDFGFGCSPDELKNVPDYVVILQTSKDVHEKAMEVLNNLSDEELSQENNINANFGGKNDKECVIMHAIRHEPMHIGQISWILKANGIRLT